MTSELFLTVLDYLMEHCPFAGHDYLALEGYRDQYTESHSERERDSVIASVERNTPRAKWATAMKYASQHVKDVANGRFSS